MDQNSYTLKEVQIVFVKYHRSTLLFYMLFFVQLNLDHCMDFIFLLCRLGVEYGNMGILTQTSLTLQYIFVHFLTFLIYSISFSLVFLLLFGVVFSLVFLILSLYFIFQSLFIIFSLLQPNLFFFILLNSSLCPYQHMHSDNSHPHISQFD